VPAESEGGGGGGGLIIGGGSEASSLDRDLHVTKGKEGGCYEKKGKKMEP